MTVDIPATTALRPVALQSGSLSTRLVEGAAAVIGLALLAAALAAAVAVVYRWYARERVPGGLPALVGLSGVAVYLNSTTALQQVIGNTGDPLDESVALFNIVTVLVSLFATRAGTDVGDRVGTDVFVATGARQVEGEVGRLVQAVGRVITVELPEEIDDVVGYDPVPDETKAALAGRSFVFPRRLTVDELRDRLVTRLQADYAVGHVDIELADDGTVEYLALGSRASGIGPTLPPETSAVAIRADPAFAASAGDLVQVWRTDPMERVLTAELRGKVDDVVTLAVDAADTRRLDDDAEYRLVTLPVETRPDREFASVLRAADETMAAVTVGADGPLAGRSVDALDVTVVAVRPDDGPVEALPTGDRRLAAGDVAYVVATPDAIRRVEERVRPDGTTASPGSTMPPDKRVDAATPVAGGEADDSGDASTGAPDESGRDTGRSDASNQAGDVPSADASSTDTSSADSSMADASSADAVADALADDDLPGIRALERDDETADDGETAGDGETASDGETAGDGETAIDGETDDDENDDGETGSAGDADALSEWTTLDDAEPTRETLSDLPGTDPADLPGTNDDEPRDADSEASDGADTSATDDSGDSGDSGDASDPGDADAAVDGDDDVSSDDAPGSDDGKRDGEG